MSTHAKLTAKEFDAMAEHGSFDVLGPKKIELIHGELRIISQAGPIHDDFIEYLTRWSIKSADEAVATVRVQCGFACEEHRPEPDVLWLKPVRYGRRRPTAAEVLLLIEISDSSLVGDLNEKADLYAAAGICEYWVIDIPNQRLHRMSHSDGTGYRRIETVVPPHRPAPLCQPDAELNLEELFEVL